MSPITRVLDEEGHVLHDCIEGACTVSWDGIALTGFTREEPHPHDPTQTVTVQVNEGDEIPNRQDANPKHWDVQGDTAQRRRD